MPLSHEINSNHHNIKVNQNILRELKSEVKDIKEDLDKMNEKINFIYNYIVQKKEKEDARWF
jgi:peptidoglycan hydrolase CwlO-like protein